MKPNLLAYKNLPRFDDGRINYTNAKEALGLHVVVSFPCDEEVFLLLKRSDNVSSAKGAWLFCGGYVDDGLSYEEKALLELEEETGITKEQVKSIRVGQEISFQANILWHIMPVFVELKKTANPPVVTLDWEHTDYVWATYEKANEYLQLPGAKETLKQVREKR